MRHEPLERLVKVPDVIAQIVEDINSDDYNDSMIMINRYNQLSGERRELVNLFFIDLCGYTLPSLIERAKENNFFVEVE